MFRIDIGPEKADDKPVDRKATVMEEFIAAVGNKDAAKASEALTTFNRLCKLDSDDSVAEPEDTYADDEE